MFDPNEDGVRHDKGVVLIVKKDGDHGDEYLILHREKDWSGWEIPKGHLEEDDHDHTAKLELEEEAGISEDKIIEMENTNDTLSWSYTWDGQPITCTYQVYVIEVEPDAEVDVSENPDREHVEGEFVSLWEAIEVIKHDDQKKALKKYG